MTLLPYVTLPNGVLVGSTLLVCFLLPVAILVSRDRLRKYRRGLLLALEELIYKGEANRPMTAFEVARIKYEMGPRDQSGGAGDSGMASRGSILSFVLPAAIYSGLASSVFLMALFLANEPAFWQRPNLILSGLRFLGDLASSRDLASYQMRSGVLVTAGFLGAYMFSLQFLIQRVRNYELSPTSFLVASVTLLEGCFVVAVTRHLLPDGTHTGAAVPLAFLLGYFPTFGISWLLDRLRLRSLKQINPKAYNARYVMPTDMIDGIDMLTKFRLSEAGVYDIQNLATANPVLLYVETPYNLLAILDWMAQAQLMVEFGNEVAGELRKLGLRTIQDVAIIEATPQMGQVVARLIWPGIENPGPDTCARIVDVVSSKLHVRRLNAFMDALGEIVDGRTGPSGPSDLPAEWRCCA